MEKEIVLPSNFQEQMMNCELEFQNELNETNIRKLIYVYTLGMQYYNLKDKEEFENYYRTKLNNLLLNEKVITYLDTHKVDLSKKVDLDIFSQNTSGDQDSKNKKVNIKTMSHDDAEIARNPSIDLFKTKNKIKKADIIEYVNKKIREVDIKLESIDKQVINNIAEQMSNFESNKRNKKKRKGSGEVNEEKEEEKDTINDLINEEPKNPMRRRGSSIGQNKLMKEIEQYVEQNMKEMYKAIEELRQSYEGEINEAVESGFDEIAESLRNDLKAEEENLTAQYEEERMKQIEIIREKNKKT